MADVERGDCVKREDARLVLRPRQRAAGPVAAPPAEQGAHLWEGKRAEQHRLPEGGRLSGHSGV